MMKVERTSYLKLRESVVIVQQRFKANCAMKKQRNSNQQQNLSNNFGSTKIPSHFANAAAKKTIPSLEVGSNRHPAALSKRIEAL